MSWGARRAIASGSWRLEQEPFRVSFPFADLFLLVFVQPPFPSLYSHTHKQSRRSVSSLARSSAHPSIITAMDANVHKVRSTSRT